MSEKWTATIRNNTHAWGKRFELILTTQTGDTALQAQHETVLDCKAHLKRLQRQTGHTFQIFNQF